MKKLIIAVITGLLFSIAADASQAEVKPQTPMKVYSIHVEKRVFIKRHMRRYLRRLHRMHRRAVIQGRDHVRPIHHPVHH